MLVQNPATIPRLKSRQVSPVANVTCVIIMSTPPVWCNIRRMRLTAALAQFSSDHSRRFHFLASAKDHYLKISFKEKYNSLMYVNIVIVGVVIS